jgi:hypothetical protein
MGVGKAVPRPLVSAWTGQRQKFKEERETFLFVCFDGFEYKLLS